MSIARKIMTGDAGGSPSGPSDPDFANVSLLLDGDAEPITDLTGKHNVETVGTAAVSTTQKKFGTGSIDFNGNGRLAVPENGTDFTFGAGDFTIETWVYITVNVTCFIFDWRKESGNQGVMPSLRLEGNRLKYYNGALGISADFGGRLDQWLHIALVKSGTQTKLYINGTQEGVTYSDSDNYISPQDGNVYIGGRPDGFNLAGYIDDFRITKGIARYTGNFTPPTEALPKY